MKLSEKLHKVANMLIKAEFDKKSYFWIYNNLVRMKNAIKEAWSNISIQLQRRYDLIPNLVETVQGYARHERSTFENVVRARSGAVDALQQINKTMKEGGLPTTNMMQALAASDGKMTGALGGLFGNLGNLRIVFERYPDLKANQNFLKLQEELSTTENKIAQARHDYNDEVKEYNTYRETFPQNLVVKIHSKAFPEADFFEITNADVRQAPRVTFSSKQAMDAAQAVQNLEHFIDPTSEEKNAILALIKENIKNPKILEAMAKAVESKTKWKSVTELEEILK